MAENESTHTPGPWEWQTRQTTVEGYIEYVLERPDDTGIVYHSAVWAVKEADANLIAAAPELLAACKMLIDRTANPVTDHAFYTFDDARHAAIAAIAKAEASVTSPTTR